MGFLDRRISQIIESYLQDSLPENVKMLYESSKTKAEREKIINALLVKNPKTGRWEVDMSKSSEVSELPELLTSIKASEVSS